jgi:hypothetical protein
MVSRHWTASLLTVFVLTALLIPIPERALARQTPSSSEIEGTIAVRLHACPAGMRPLDLDAAACPLDPDVADLQIFVGSGENRRNLDEATPDGDAFAWSGLPFGEYVLKVTEFASGYDRYQIPSQSRGLNISPDFGYTAGPNEGYLLSLDAGHRSYLLDVYVFRAYESSGSLDLGAQLWQCPSGVVAAPDMRNLGCAALAAPPAGFALEIAGGGLTRPLQLAGAGAATSLRTQAAADDAGRLGWEAVPGGEYRVTAVLPAGTPGYAVRCYCPGVRVQVLSDHSGYALVFLLEEGALPAPSEAVLDVYLLS